MPDLNYSILLHRKHLQAIWRSGVWTEAKVKFLEHHTDNKCERCGRVGHIVPGHTSSDYLDMPSYVVKVKENKVEALCPTCNWMESKGRAPCKKCITAYQVSGGQTEIHYPPQFMELCRDCCDPGEVAIQKREQEKFKKFVRKVRDKDNAKRNKFYQEVIKPARSKKK